MGKDEPDDGATSRRRLPLVPVTVSRRRVEPHPHQVAPARRWTVEQAAAAGIADDDAAAVLELLASEVITNAVLHGSGEIAVNVVRSGTMLHVAVTDAGDGRPEPRSPEDDAVTGRGMMLVAALSESWGVEHPASGGTCVWFSVPRTTTAPARPVPAEAQRAPAPSPAA